MEKSILNKAKAAALAKREFGTAKGLKRDPGMPSGSFRMQMGNLKIEIYPWEWGCSYIIVTITRVSDYKHIHAMFDGDTLEEIYATLEMYEAELNIYRQKRLTSYLKADREGEAAENREGS